ncbi:MAG: hypothetical protein U1F16_08160 [Turneriella sp.]
MRRDEYGADATSSREDGFDRRYVTEGIVTYSVEIDSLVCADSVCSGQVYLIEVGAFPMCVSNPAMTLTVILAVNAPAVELIVLVPAPVVEMRMLDGPLRTTLPKAPFDRFWFQSKYSAMALPALSLACRVSARVKPAPDIVKRGC